MMLSPSQDPGLTTHLLTNPLLYSPGHTILLYCVQSVYRMLVRILAPSFPLWNSNVSFSVPVPQVVLTVKWKEFVWQSGYNNIWYITRLNIY